MAKTRSLLSDGAWVAGLQGLAAIGQLIGVRVLTDIMPPSVFGEVSLWLGLAALASAAMANPTMQALLRFYPEYFHKGQGALVKLVVKGQLLKLTQFALPLFMLGAIAGITLGYATAPELLLLLLLVGIDIARMGNMAYLNSLRAYKQCGIWSLIEAWGRPLFAYLLIRVVGVDTTWVLLAYLIVSVVAWGIMRRHVPKDADKTEAGASDRAELASRFWKYSIPLLPLGLIGWVSGMADRYMIGALLTPADVGLYVAIYGLASRPMSMFGGIIETTLRPAYQQALVQGKHELANNYLIKWVVLVLLGSICAIILACVGHSWLASLLLGSEYRVVSELLPWIVGGYSLLILSHVANRVCYANEATNRIFFTEATGAALAVVIGFVCIWYKGLWGAALAVPLYFGAQLAVSYCLARPWLHRHRQLG